MSDYPELCLSPDSTRTPNSGRIYEISDGGRFRAQDKYPETLYTLTIIHPAATEGERETIKKHWEENKRNDFYTAFLDGYEYVGHYADEPVYSLIGANRWRIETTVIAKQRPAEYGHLLFDDTGALQLAGGGYIKIRRQ